MLLTVVCFHERFSKVVRFVISELSFQKNSTKPETL